MVTCSAEVMGSIPSPDGFFGVLSEKKILSLSGQLQYPCTKNRMGGALGLAAGLPHYSSSQYHLRVSVNSHNSPNDLGISFFLFF